MDIDLKLKDRLGKVGIGGYTRHIVLCVGDSCSKLERPGLAEESWTRLKDLLRDKGLAPTPVCRTKCHCLRVCSQGPIGVVYPEGVWYRNLNPENIERIVGEHLENGRIVEDLVLAMNPLPIAVKDASS